MALVDLSLLQLKQKEWVAHDSLVHEIKNVDAAKQYSATCIQQMKKEGVRQRVQLQEMRMKIAMQKGDPMESWRTKRFQTA